MNNEILRKIDAELTGYLADLFGYEPSRHGAYDVRDPANHGMFKHNESKLVSMAPEIGSMQIMKTLDLGACFIEEGKSHKMDSYFSLISANRDEDYPGLLGLTILEAEHGIRHNVGEDEAGYYGSFHSPYRNMIAYLGQLAAHRHINGYDPDKAPEVIMDSEPTMNTTLGRLAAHALFTGGGDIPYRALFNAQNHGQGWKIAHQAADILFSFDAGALRNELVPAFIEATTEMQVAPMIISAIGSTAYERPRQSKPRRYRPSIN